MDILSDTSKAQLIRISDKYAMPDYVKTAEILEKTAAEQLPELLFADPIAKQFPINDKANTWLSAAYFNENGHQIKEAVHYDMVKGNIEKAAAIYGILEDVRNVFSIEPDAVTKSITKAAEVLPPEAVVAPVEDEQALYPILSPEHVKLAEQHFIENMARIEPPVRRQIAVHIMKRANDFGHPVSRIVIKTAGFAMPDKGGIIELLNTIMSKAAEAAMIPAITGLQQKVAAMPVEQIDDSLLGELFKAAAASGIPFPELEAYGPTVPDIMLTKAAAVKLANYTFDAIKLAELPRDVFDMALGKDVVDTYLMDNGKLSAVKIAEVIPDLPMPDKLLLERAIINAVENQ